MHTTLSNAATNTTGWLATVTGLVQLVGLASLLVFFAIGEPFGTINDVCIALTAILCAVLAWQIAALGGQPDGLGRLALALAGVGAFIVAVGSALVIFRVTGFVLAGFVNALGNALIGLWLLAACWAALGGAGWPRGLVILGLVTGAIMLLGFFAVPAIVQRLDSMAINPWYVIVGYVSWLGTFILLPVWCLWLGRFSLAR